MKKIKEEDKTLIMLMGEVTRQFGHNIREFEKRNGLGPAINSILLNLKCSGELTQVEIVNKIHMRPSSVSVALQKMEKDGLIEKHMKDDDQRCSVISITKKGENICDTIKNNIKELDCSLTKDIDKQDLEIAKNVIRKINEKFMEVDKE